MIDLARHSMRSDYLFHHCVPFFIYGVELGATLTIILLAGTLSLQVNGIYVLSLYAEMFKVAIFIIEVNCWFILLPRSACRRTQDSDKIIQLTSVGLPFMNLLIRSRSSIGVRGSMGKLHHDDAGVAGRFRRGNVW